jgi:hypothetical protein
MLDNDWQGELQINMDIMMEAMYSWYTKTSLIWISRYFKF